MIDIIIPAYNAHDTISKTLFSILLQNISNLCNIYIVNDCSKKNYKDIISRFSKYLNIKELNLEVNSGPGVARQYGIDNSKSEFIVFIDADDIFYNQFSLKKMLDSIKNTDNDIVIFDFLEECRVGILQHQNDDIWMHGKIYRRKFIEKNKIRFNDSRANEDSGFNRLCFVLNPKIKYINDNVYVWKYVETSITRVNNHEYLFSGIEGYTYNMVWVIKQAEERMCSKQNIAKLLFMTLLEIYYCYLEYEKEKKSKKILVWCIELVKYYEIYKEYLLDIDKKKIITKQILKVLKNMDMINNIIAPITFDNFIDMIKEVEND